MTRLGARAAGPGPGQNLTSLSGGELGLGIRIDGGIAHLPLADGINAVRTILPRCWFDQEKCERGIQALNQYQRRWNDERRMFEDQPLHDWTSHAADAFRDGALTVKDHARRPDPPPGWVMPETPPRGTIVWPPWEWGSPEYPRTIEIHDDPDSPY